MSRESFLAEAKQIEERARAQFSQDMTAVFAAQKAKMAQWEQALNAAAAKHGVTFRNGLGPKVVLGADARHKFEVLQRNEGGSRPQVFPGSIP